MAIAFRTDPGESCGAVEVARDCIDCPQRQTRVGTVRVLFISNASSIHTVRWVNALAKRGHDVHLAHIAGHEPELDRIDERVSIHRLPVPGPAGYYLNALPLRRLAFGLDPDVAHAHYASGYGTLSRLARIPYLLSVWGSDVYEFPYRNRSSLSILRRNLRSASALASTSECMAEQVRNVLGDPTVPITVTPFGIDLARFDPDDLIAHDGTDRMIIGNVKALAGSYGIDVLIRAAGLLRDRLPGRLFEVRVYGEGPQRSEIERLVSGLGLGDVVQLAGQIPHDEVPSVLAQLDIFCATSLRESFGVAVVEAMAMRCPVVVSNAEGFTEVVGDAGLVVPRGDAEATASALARLATDRRLRDSLGKAGRLRVERLYNWESNVDAVVDLYMQISRRP